MKYTVESLKKIGYKVHVDHYRLDHLEYLFDSDCVYYRTRDLYKRYGKLNQVHTHGGETIVTLENECGFQIANGKSFCSVKNHYNKKFGVKVALLRALKIAGIAYKKNKMPQYEECLKTLSMEQLAKYLFEFVIIGGDKELALQMYKDAYIMKGLYD